MRSIFPNPEEVFTPRAAQINPEMYVERPELEEALKAGLKSQQHLVIHGESGTGKSWLYKKVLFDTQTRFEIANLANASRLGSITAELQNVVSRHGEVTKKGFEESKSASLDAVFASGSLQNVGKYELGQKEPFEACLSAMHGRAAGKVSVLVLDNLEAAFTPPQLKELADLIILSDDERYAKYAVRLLIVGVPSGVKEYYYNTPHHATVANRIREIPEVSRLTFNQCQKLMKQGFESKLGCTIVNPDIIYDHISWVTDRIPQMIHEYCLEIAILAEANNRTINSDTLSKADNLWLKQSMYHGYAVVEHHMNERDTRTGRRNQTLFALGCSDQEQVKASDVEGIIRREFPRSTSQTILNVTQILSQLSAGDRPIIRRSPKGDAYVFADPRYRMVLRAMLLKDSDERVEKVSLAGL